MPLGTFVKHLKITIDIGHLKVIKSQHSHVRHQAPGVNMKPCMCNSELWKIYSKASSAIYD